MLRLPLHTLRSARGGSGRTWERRRCHGGHGHGRHGDAAEGAVVDPTGGAHRGRGLDARARAPRRALLRQTGRVFPSLPRRLHLGGGEERDERHWGEPMAVWGAAAPASSQAHGPAALRTGVTFRVRSAVGKDIWERPMALWMWCSLRRMGMLCVSPAWRRQEAMGPGTEAAGRRVTCPSGLVLCSDTS